MTLVQLRTSFAELVTDWSLVTDYPNADYTDAGADVFINRAQRWLNLVFAGMADTLGVGDSDTTFTLSEDAVSFAATNLRVPQEVWAYDPALPDDRIAVKHLDINGFLEKSGVDPTAQDTGPPVYWSTKAAAAETILIQPPADKDYTMVVIGRYMLADLSGESTENWWTTRYPDVLIKAAARDYALRLHNEKAASMWEAEVRKELAIINADMQDVRMGYEPLQLPG